MIGYEWCPVHMKYEQSHTAPCIKPRFIFGKTWVWNGFEYRLVATEEGKS
jgi:hypothetical protein